MSEKMEEAIERYMRDSEHKAISLYTNGCKEGKNEGYTLGKASGITEAWQLMRELTEMSWERFNKVFCGYDGIGEVIDRLDYYEVKHCLEEFSKDELDNIEVGDEVIDPNGLRAIVTNTDTAYHLFYPNNGKTWKAPSIDIVRCKECKFGTLLEDVGMYSCTANDQDLYEAEHFCSYGGRVDTPQTKSVCTGCEHYATDDCENGCVGFEWAMP